MKYATFGQDGKLTGRYDDAIHKIIPPGAVAITDEIFARSISEMDGIWKMVDGFVTKAAFPTPTPEQAFARLVKQFDAAVEAHLHAEATAHGYTNIERACMYAPVPNPYEAESRSFVEWVGAVWDYCFQEIQKVEQGIRPIPDLQSFITELPERGYVNV